MSTQGEQIADCESKCQSENVKIVTETKRRKNND